MFLDTVDYRIKSLGLQVRKQHRIQHASTDFYLELFRVWTDNKKLNTIHVKEQLKKIQSTLQIQECKLKIKRAHQNL